MNRRARLLPALLPLALAGAPARAGDGAASAASPPPASAPAAPASVPAAESPLMPGFKLAALDGRVIDTAAEQRGRPLLIAYWASWCIPCRREAPLLRGLKHRWGERLLLVGVAASDGESEGDARGFVAKYALNYPNVFDRDGGLAVLYNISAVPQLLLIGPDGRLLLRTMNFDAVEKALLERYPEPAASAPARKPPRARRAPAK